MRARWDILYQDKYKLPEELIGKAVRFSEFANGGAQATIKLKDGRVIGEVLVSNASYVAAVRGYQSMPFSMADVADIYQSQDDKDVEDRKKWVCWEK